MEKDLREDEVVEVAPLQCHLPSDSWWASSQQKPIEHQTGFRQ